MRFQVFVTDYDGTLADWGQVHPEVEMPLLRAQAAGLRLVLATGRQLPDLQHVFPGCSRFDALIVENGASAWLPAEGVRLHWAGAPDAQYVERLRSAGVSPLDVGESIIATRRLWLSTATRLARELRLDTAPSLNEDSLMLLPAGIDKGSGLTKLLEHWEIPKSASAAIGNAENDLPLLAASGLGAAVAYSHPLLQAAAAYRCKKSGSLGVLEFLQFILGN